MTIAPKVLCNGKSTTSSASAVLLSEKRQRLKFVMDGLGIVYLIENAQQFWSGALGRHPHSNAALAASC